MTYQVTCKRNAFLAVLAFFVLSFSAVKADFTSTQNGAWNSGTVWGGTAPGDPYSWTTINVGHTISKNSALTVNGTLNVGSTSNTSANLTITGDVTVTGGSVINVYGTITITGNLTLNGRFNVYPGAQVLVNGQVYVNDSDYLTIGTNASGPPYAQMAIKQNLYSSGGGGDILVQKNGRLAVFGNFSSNGSGGSVLTVKDNGEVYIKGTITFNGGNDHLTNDNNGSPYYGVYSNNQPVYTGGGSSSNGAAGSNSVQNESQINNEFKTWILSLGAMPVTLASFDAKNIGPEGIALAWSTTTEINFHYFNLQRSADGLVFETIATIQGNGTTTKRHDYSYTDRLPFAGTSYYRLQSVDFDEYTETFKVIAVNVEGNRDATLYPMPVTRSELNVALNFVPKEEVYVLISDLSGCVVSQAVIKAGESGLLSIPLSVTPGFYTVRVNSGEVHKVTKLLVK